MNLHVLECPEHDLTIFWKNVYLIVNETWLDAATRETISFLACFLLSNFTGVRYFSWFLHFSHGKFFTFEPRVFILDFFFFLSFILVCVGEDTKILWQV